MGPREWLKVVAAAHAAGAGTWSQDGVAAHRVGGGANNALYRIEVGGQRYGCKLCVPDERRRAAREYGVLRLLHMAGPGVAPEPLLLDESCTLVGYPAVIYRWVPGVPLGPSLTGEQLAALLESFHRFHMLQASDYQDAELADAFFHWFDVKPYLDEMEGRLAQYGPWLVTVVPEGRALRERLARLVAGCAEAVTAAPADLSRESVPLCLCHVDPNLANALWHTDRRVRWVDWEYSGWGDPALNLAELRWHIASSGLSEAQQAWLRAHYRPPADDPGFEARLAAWDRILAVHWPLLILRALWSQHNGPDRLRLTRLVADADELHVRLIRFIWRAECLAGVERWQT